MNYSFLEKKAIELRNSIGLGDKDPIIVENILPQLGVLAIFKPLSEGFCGMALKSDENRFMLINSEHSIGKQHFTVCHELYHLFVQENFKSVVCNNVGAFNKKAGEEYNADMFASLLLMPAAAINSLVPDKEFDRNKISLGTILRLEQYFSCSRSALLYRLSKLGFITYETYEPLRKNIMRSAIEYGYKTDLYKKSNENTSIGNYGELTRKLFDEGLISETHYISLLYDLGMKEEDLATIFEDTTKNED